MLKSLSSVFGMTGSGISLFAFLYLIVRYVSVLDFSDLESFGIGILASAAGFICSILISKKPRPAGIILIASGILDYFFLTRALFEAAPGWIAFISAFLLTAAGVLAIISAHREPKNAGPGPAGKGEEEAQPIFTSQKVSRLFGDPVLKKLICISGVTGILLAVLPYILFIAADAYFYFDDYELLISIALLIVPVLTLTATAFAFSAIAVLRFFIRKRPLIAAIIMIVFSGLNLSAHFPRDYYLAPPALFDIIRIISALLLIASAAFTLIAGKTSSVEGPRNKNPDRAAKG